MTQSTANKEKAMKRTTLVLTAVGALALSAAPAAAKSHGRTITIKATSHIDQVQLVDNAPTGGSPGDVLVFTEKLFNARGKQIGTDAASCVRLFDLTSLCTGTYKLPGGRLMVQLLQPGPIGIYDQAITGGTGRFAAARGTVTVDQRPDGDRFTFKIRRDRR
jgi:hypothetical protein